MNIALSNIIAGTPGNVLQSAGAPSAGTSAVDTITLGGTPTGGTFALAFDGYATGPIAWSATNATLLANIDSALEALPSASDGAGGAFTVAAGTLTAGIGTIAVTYTGPLASKGGVGPVSVASNNLTGTSPTVAVANTTAGVTATFRGQGAGTTVVDTTTGILYENVGTAYSPSWVKTGTQS